MSISGDHINRVVKIELVADRQTEKMIANGPRRIRMGVKSSRFA